MATLTTKMLINVVIGDSRASVFSNVELKYNCTTNLKTET